MNGDRTIMVEILNAIEHGTLSVHETRRRLEDIIDKEIIRTEAPANMQLVEECEKLLWELNTNGKIPFVGHLEENKVSILRRSRNWNSFYAFKKYALRISAVAGAMLILIIGAEILFHREWLNTSTSSDGEQLIISGEISDPGLISEGNANNDESSSQLTTKHRNEAFSFLNGDLFAPEELPGDWYASLYFCSKTNEITNLNTLYYNRTNDDNALTLDILRFNSIQDTYITFEQNSMGEHVSYNGINLYVAQNIDDTVLMWTNDNYMYVLSGVIGLDEALSIIDLLLIGDINDE